MYAFVFTTIYRHNVITSRVGFHITKDHWVTTRVVFIASTSPMRSDDALVFSLLETAVSPLTCLDGDLSSSSCCRTTKASPILGAGRKVTLPETNIYLKMDGWKTSFLLRFGIVIFRCKLFDSGMAICSSTETFPRDGSYIFLLRLRFPRIFWLLMIGWWL